MTSHEAISGAAGGSMASGFAGLVFSYFRLPDPATVSSLMSLAGIVAAGGIMLWQNLSRARRRDHNDCIESESQEIQLLHVRVREIISENIEMSRQLVELNKKLVDASVKRTCEEKREHAEPKDGNDAKEAAGRADDLGMLVRP